MSSLVALDIGGAHLKGADGLGRSVARAFPLWKHPERLSAALVELLAELPPTQRVVATMTGELADCFATKSDGVRAIVDALERATSGKSVAWYAVNGSWRTSDQARGEPMRVAASNWHALASFAARYVPRSGLLIDLGSTTCDLIPIAAGSVVAQGVCDTTRLLTGELVYSGVERTTVCGLVQSVPWRDTPCPVAREHFATTRDVYLLLGDLAEEPECHDTADGRAATRGAAWGRLARMICADVELVTLDDVRRIAEHVSHAQQAEIVAAGRRVAQCLGEVETIVISGQGEFLAQRAAAEIAPRATIVSLAKLADPLVSRIGPAHALAVLAREAGL